MILAPSVGSVSKYDIRRCQTTRWGSGYTLDTVAREIEANSEEEALLLYLQRELGARFETIEYEYLRAPGGLAEELLPHASTWQEEVGVIERECGCEFGVRFGIERGKREAWFIPKQVEVLVAHVEVDTTCAEHKGSYPDDIRAGSTYGAVEHNPRWRERVGLDGIGGDPPHARKP